MPFNKSIKNPDDKRGFKVSYLYYDIWHPDSLLEIIGRFFKVIKKKDKKGKEKEVLIFPRYHQLTATKRLVRSAKKKKSGRNYLFI